MSYNTYKSYKGKEAQNIKLPINKGTETDLVLDSDGKVTDNASPKTKPFLSDLITKSTTEDYLRALNMVSGGVLFSILTTPMWESRVTKASLGLLYSKEADLFLSFQYNPEVLVEKLSVSYSYRQSYAGEPTITEFKAVEPEKVLIEFWLDAYEDYAGLDEYYKNIIAGTAQSAMLAVKLGTQGFSYISQIADTMSNLKVIPKIEDKRSLKDAINNLKRFCKNSTYSYNDSEGSSKTTYLGNPPLCVLNWGLYNDFKCVVKDIVFEHKMFNPTTLDPIRTKVTMELEEYYNPFVDEYKSLYDGKIAQLDL